MTNMSEIKKEVQHHLLVDLLPFWKSLIDEEMGGFYGYTSNDYEVDKYAVKGCILNNRITWFFSNAYTVLQDESLLKYAKQGYEFLRDYCVDKKNGGVYWSVTFDGKPKEKIKHTYNQAFSIYALSSYYEASGDKKALELAYEIFEIIENKMKDDKGYKEAFDENFCEIGNEKLSENGVMAEKTMNTLLHVCEAYTELYRVDHHEKVKEKIEWMLQIIAQKVYNPDLHRLEVFFDKDWNTLIDLHSYGHDIEAAWLIDRALDILQDNELSQNISPITKALTERIFDKAYDGNSVANECANGIENTWRVWWIQAEAIVGFLNGYEKTKDEKYLEAVWQLWEYCKNYLVVNHTKSDAGREWYWRVDSDGNPDDSMELAGPWKCPYHNGRMCFEVIKRVK